ANAVKDLANDALACAKSLKPGKHLVQFVLAGGTLLKQPEFAGKLKLRLQKLCPAATVTTLKRESAWGAVALAKKNWIAPKGARVKEGLEVPVRTAERPVGLPPTEQRNPRSANLDKLSIAQAIRLMLSEDVKIPAAVLRESKPIEQA